MCVSDRRSIYLEDWATAPPSTTCPLRLGESRGKLSFTTNPYWNLAAPKCVHTAANMVHTLWLWHCVDFQAQRMIKALCCVFSNKQVVSFTK